jgi:hypothetical protein
VEKIGKVSAKQASNKVQSILTFMIKGQELAEILQFKNGQTLIPRLLLKKMADKLGNLEVDRIPELKNTH